jgi:hypothetical protein
MPYPSSQRSGPAPLNSALGLMSKLPTDLQVLENIYRMYAKDFKTFSRDEPSRAAKIYVPIDVAAVAKRLDTDAHELFGRLYYHLDHKYRYRQDDGSFVHLFAFAVGNDRHCINYPYLAAVLSALRQEDSRNAWSLRFSILSLILAAAAIVAQIATS